MGNSIDYTETTIKAYRCQECFKYFFTNRGIKKHIKLSHEGLILKDKRQLELLNSEENYTARELL